MKKLFLFTALLLLILGCSNENKFYDIEQGTENISLSKGKPTPPPPTPDVIADMDTITFNGAGKINLVFVAEGFTASEMSVFDDAVDDAITAFFAKEPYASRVGDFNTFKWATVSNESGISVDTHPLNPETVVVKDTYWDMVRNSSGLGRDMSFDHNTITYFGCDYDFYHQWRLRYDLIGSNGDTGHFLNPTFALVIINTPLYGGAGAFTDDTWSGNAVGSQKLYPNEITSTCYQPFFLSLAGSTSGNSDITYGWAATGLSTESGANGYFPFLVQHEFGGHTVGDLDDEYYDATIYNNSEYFAALWFNPLKDNITDDPVNDPKWDNWVSNPQYISGGRYYPNGTTERYRSSQTSIMQVASQTGVFNEVSQYIINQRLDAYLAEYPYW